MSILCIGSVNRDIVYTVDHIAAEGETVQAHAVRENWGGKGLNQAVALARGGGQVRLAAAVNYAQQGLLEHLETYGIQPAPLDFVEAPTGHAIICVDKKGQNSITVFGGANHTLTADFIRRVLTSCQTGDALVLQNEVNGLEEIMVQAKEKGVHTFFNPSPFNHAILELPLHLVDCFVLNEIEGQQLTGKKQPEEILQQIRNRYPRAKVLLTLGDAGSCYMDGQTIYKQQAFPVVAKDTTAAGDTFTGFFVAALDSGISPQQALRRAAAAASLTVSRPGAAESIPTLAETQQFLQTV